MISFDILQKNAAYVRQLRRQENAVELGQLNELARMAFHSQTQLSPRDAANLYLQAFPDMRLLSENYTVFLKILSEKNLLIPVRQATEKQGTLFYMPNRNTEIAREKFSTLLPHSCLSPQTDFLTICESVASEDNSFCILPVYSSTEGELPAFARMIREYQLKTRAMYDVTTSDGETELRFALLSGQIYWSPDAAFMEISFQPESGEELTTSLAALQRLGASLYSINARPMEYNMNSFLYKITVKVMPGSIDSIAAFVSVAMRTGVSGVFNIL